MAHETAAETPQKTFGLPVLVASPVDVGRLIRELEVIDGALLQVKLQKDSQDRLPKTSHLMDQTAQLNKLDLSNDHDRKQLQEFLVLVKQKAPILHISFSADPTTAFIEKIMAWLRREIHPSVLLTIGLQPNIGAGCVVRSTNKYFDFSLRKDFETKRDLLLGTLGAAEVTAARTASAPVANAPAPVAQGAAT
ncbi:MAG: hypothetical protein JWO35_265 [Candidatus Saccharibacteria bacterium]|nr:hypothetical protein [Candidatus Saccharibacteria bacterium]